MLDATFDDEAARIMNVYDFDGTIFYSDCSIGFAIWCMKRHPTLWFTCFPGVIKDLILYKTGRIPNYRMQRRMFSYLTRIDDFEEQISLINDHYQKSPGISSGFCNR